MDTIKTKKHVSYKTVRETFSLEDNYMFLLNVIDSLRDLWLLFFRLWKMVEEV